MKRPSLIHESFASRADAKQDLEQSMIRKCVEVSGQSGDSVLYWTANCGVSEPAEIEAFEVRRAKTATICGKVLKNALWI